jgi:adenylylsulfate kinase-like enzyme
MTDALGSLYIREPSHEGLNNSCNLRLSVIALVERKFVELGNGGVVLIRGPPATGKTTFGQIFQAYLKAKRITNYRLTLLDWNVNTRYTLMFRHVRTIR